MEPVHWLLSGLGACLVLCGAGFWLAWWTRGKELLLEKERLAHVFAQLQESLRRGAAGVAAAQIVVDSERKLAEAALAPPGRRRRRLLLGAAPGDADLPADPSGEASGPDDGAPGAGEALGRGGNGTG